MNSDAHTPASSQASCLEAVEAHERFDLPPGCVEGYVTANGQRLHYVSAGEGPLAILLHGFPEFWYSWRHNLPALARIRRVVALDMRGYNLSDKPATGYDIATLTTDIRCVIEAFGERQADIIGHDWGGALAWVFAIREPDYVRRLVVLNAPHPGPMSRALRHPRQLLRSAYIGFFQFNGLAERAIAADHFGSVWRVFRSADPHRAWLSDTDIQRLVDAIARPGALSAALEYYRQLVRRGPAVVGVTRVITAPTLTLWGEQDPYLGVELLDDLECWVHDLRIVRFPGVGHWLNQQRAHEVNAAIVAFLSEDSEERPQR
ncbi:MAG TPA: alpha/beta hydrolase [Ktedonobacterales bacterium]|nr:alpha/beta hydrolase [Ktedonobacterales bacterium]